DGGGLVDVERDLGAEQVLDRRDLAPLVHRPVVAAGDDAQAAVLRQRVVDGEPERDHLHRLQLRPVGGVLVPEHGLAVAGWLAHVLRGEERDAVADELRGDVEEAVVADQAHPEGVVGEQVDAKRLRAPPRVARGEPVDMGGHLVDELNVEDVGEHRVALAGVVLQRRLGGRGGAHRRRPGQRRRVCTKRRRRDAAAAPAAPPLGAGGAGAGMRLPAKTSAPSAVSRVPGSRLRSGSPAATARIGVLRSGAALTGARGAAGTTGAVSTVGMVTTAGTGGGVGTKRSAGGSGGSTVLPSSVVRMVRIAEAWRTHGVSWSPGLGSGTGGAAGGEGGVNGSAGIVATGDVKGEGQAVAAGEPAPMS